MTFARGLSITVFTALATLAFLGGRADAAPIHLRQVAVADATRVDLVFDGKIDRKQIKTEFFRDIVQVTLTDATVYPAKISNVSGAGRLKKVFAYQYAPKVVRCRFSVDGNAEDFKDFLALNPRGKTLTVAFRSGQEASDSLVQSAAKAVPAAEATADTALLERVRKLAAADEQKSAGPAQQQQQQTEKQQQSQAAGVTSSVATNAPAAAGAPAAQPPGSALSPQTSAATATATAGVATPTAVGTASSSVPAGPEGALLSKSDTPRSSTKLTGYAARAGGALVFLGLVLGALYFALKVAKKREGGGVVAAIGRFAKARLGADSRLIQVVASHYLGPKKSIAVVKISGRTLVLGITDESINLISRLDGSEEEAVARDSESETGASIESAMGFDALLGQEKNRPAARPERSAVGTGAARARVRSRLEGMKPL